MSDTPMICSECAKLPLNRTQPCKHVQDLIDDLVRHRDIAAQWRKVATERAQENIRLEDGFTLLQSANIALKTRMAAWYGALEELSRWPEDVVAQYVMETPVIQRDIDPVKGINRNVIEVEKTVIHPERIKGLFQAIHAKVDEMMPFAIQAVESLYANERMKSHLCAIQQTVDTQAEDEVLWCGTDTQQGRFLQTALKGLHRVIEGTVDEPEEEE